MNKYELTLVLPDKATAAKKKSVSETIEKMVKVFKGKIIKTNDWGEIPLAYEIKKNKNGNFLFFELELEGEFAKQLQDKLKMEEGVIRHLLVRLEK